MDAYHVIGILLTIVGLFCLYAGLYFTYQICLATKVAKTLWHLLFVIIIVFVLGYFVFIVNIPSMQRSVVLTSLYIMYSMGGFFVLLATFAGYRTVHLINESSRLTLENNLLSYRASHDHLTQLMSRGAFEAAFQEVVEKLARGGPEYAIIFIDIDGFKAINDRYGHAAGDFILKKVANIFQQRARITDLLARYGGDEFILLLYNTTLAQAKVFAETLAQTLLETKYFYGDHNIAITCSFGVASVTKDMLDINDLIKQADLAVYKAKALGAGQIMSSE